jgi:hypothetical protein
MSNVLQSPHEIAPKNLTPINPWLIRASIFIMGLVFVMTPFWGWYSESASSKATVASNALINKEMERAYEVLCADERFKGIKVYVFEDSIPSICLSGKVANDEEMYQLRESIGFIRLKVKLKWMVVSATSKNSDAIP